MSVRPFRNPKNECGKKAVVPANTLLIYYQIKSQIGYFSCNWRAFRDIELLRKLPCLMPLGTITAKQNGNICTNWKQCMIFFFISMLQDGKLFRQNSFLVTSTNRNFYCQHSCCNGIAAMILLSYNTNCSTKTRLVIVITRRLLPPLNIHYMKRWTMFAT